MIAWRYEIIVLPALVALEGCVGLHVSPQVGPVRKTLPTVSAAEGLVTSVGPQVALQQPGPREGFPTDVALVVEVVGEDVHGEGRHAHVHLPAHPALLGRAGAQAQVGLLVSANIYRARNLSFFFINI